MNTPQTIQEGFCVLVDGGCLNNNKPVSERKMYGSMTVFYDGKQKATHYLRNNEPDPRDLQHVLVHKFSVPPTNGLASNNMAEVAMVRTAVRYAHQLVCRMQHKGQPVPTQIAILTDSEFAIGAVTGTFHLKPATEINLHNWVTDVRYYTDELEKAGCEIVYDHVDNLWVKSVLGH